MPPGENAAQWANLSIFRLGILCQEAHNRVKLFGEQATICLGQNHVYIGRRDSTSAQQRRQHLLNLREIGGIRR